MHNNKNIKIIASDKNWIESNAINQLETTAQLSGIVAAVGLPDLHPGKGSPIGAVFVSKSWIYPHIVGNDIGCGMGFYKTDLKAQKINLDKWASKLDRLDLPWGGDISEWLNVDNIEPTQFDNSLGTIGSGNHFAELQKVEKIYDEEEFETLGLNKKQIYLLIHSGSRGLGESILRAHTDINAAKGLHEDSNEANKYIEKHNNAIKWAKANRALIAHRFLLCLGSNGKLILDTTHNSVFDQNIDGEKFWIHRKGATPSIEGVVIIPGSRGDFTYLVKPIGPQKENAYSLAHGAGRKWKRSDTKGKLAKFKANDFIKTRLGSLVICEDKDLIYEEAPQAYKNIDIVIEDLVNAGLVKIVATFRPLLTYKTRRR